ncbi:NAD-dependent protein deacylase [Listeria sp. ILCC797]|uniref:NAD-dependent protein deacylase n=1 Tax=Listeria sp. ILCC797 TaxID=1918333 RepID=UPI000B58A2E9|nr:NAD-dependent protein deacylase [Listeria sp. ILCC797]
MENVKQLQAAIFNASKIVFLTGAGVSVPSGIPDYRSKDGLYKGYQNPEYLLSATCLKREPELFYDFVTKNMYYPKAKPNGIHLKMAELERDKAITIITQNIDGLHEKAGSKKVIDFHGNLYDCYCQNCGAAIPAAEYLKSRIHAQCGGEVRPNVVLYGEGISEEPISGAVFAVQTADLIVIVGTSFQVSPFCNLIEYRNNQAAIFAVNKEALRIAAPVEMIQADALRVFESL